MARDMQHAGACEVQGRLLAEMGQQAGRILLYLGSRLLVKYTALGDIIRAPH